MRDIINTKLFHYFSVYIYIQNICIYSVYIYIYKIGILLVYNVVPVSAIQLSELAVCIHISLLVNFLPPCPSISPCRSAQSTELCSLSYRVGSHLRLFKNFKRNYVKITLISESTILRFERNNLQLFVHT